MIRVIERSDAAGIAALHLQVLRSHLRGVAGSHLVAAYYRALAIGKGGIGYVSVENDGRVSGFVCGIWEQRLVRGILFRHEWPRLLGWGGILLMLTPALLRDVWSRSVPRRGVGRGSGVATAGGEYELRPIAVAAEFRGQGVAERLLMRLVDDAQNRGFHSIILKTEVDNGRANAFYVKRGFVVERTIDGYNHYRLAI